MIFFEVFFTHSASAHAFKKHSKLKFFFSISVYFSILHATIFLLIHALNHWFTFWSKVWHNKKFNFSWFKNFPRPILSPDFENLKISGPLLGNSKTRKSQLFHASDSLDTKLWNFRNFSIDGLSHVIKWRCSEYDATCSQDTCQCKQPQKQSIQNHSNVFPILYYLFSSTVQIQRKKRQEQA